ncbi:MAG: acyltransferase [Ruminococcus sp.]|nr:acyltransferase [Ruminococcus sp.]
MNYKTINTKLLSKYRAPLMGVAIILIFIFHSANPIENNAIAEFIRGHCDVGVEIFFLLSGVGCFYSMKKNKTLQFYKRRLIKLLPPYFFAVLGYLVLTVFIMRSKTVLEVVNNYSLWSLFTNGSPSVWFISAILVDYLFAPLIFKALESGRLKVLIIASVGICIISLLCDYIFTESVFFTINHLYISRIPIFILGLILGYSFYYNKSINVNIVFLLLSLIVSITALYFVVKFSLGFVLVRIMYAPISISGSLIICKLLDLGKDNIIKKGLASLGTITLEFYLLHETVSSYVHEAVLPFVYNQIWIANILAFIASVVVSYLFSILVKLFLTLLRKMLKPRKIE